MIDCDPWVHDPNAVLTYAFDWSEWFTNAPSGDEIANATVIATPGNIAISAIDFTADPHVVTFTVSGGVVDATESIVCHITTVSGLQDDKTQLMLIQEL